MIKHQDSIADLRVHVRTPRQRAWATLVWVRDAVYLARGYEGNRVRPAGLRRCNSQALPRFASVGASAHRPRPTTLQVKPRRRLGLQRGGQEMLC